MSRLLLIGAAALALSAVEGCEKGDPVLRAQEAFKKEDYKQAMILAQPEAEKGSAKAQVLLGLMFSQGKGAPEDFKLAAQYFTMAAEQGYGSAQFNLGFLYEQGLGVAEDPLEAYKWYALAAAQGDADAKANLETLANSMKPKQREAAKKRVAEFHAKTPSK